MRRRALSRSYRARAGRGLSTCPGPYTHRAPRRASILARDAGVAEGSVDGLLDTIARLRALGPTRLIHGHAPLTENFTFAVLEPLAGALTAVRDATVRSLREGRTLQEIDQLAA